MSEFLTSSDFCDATEFSNISNYIGKNNGGIDIEVYTIKSLLLYSSEFLHALILTSPCLTSDISPGVEVEIKLTLCSPKENQDRMTAFF